MATEIIMPKLGLTMEEGTVIEWCKKEGDHVEKGETLFVIETEKVTFDVEAPTSGILGKILVPAGETRQVGQSLAHMVAIGEPAPVFPESPAADSVQVPASQVEIAPPSSSRQRIDISPSAKNLAREQGVDIATIVGTGPEGRIIKEDILQAVQKSKTGVNAVDDPAPAGLPQKVKRVELTATRRTIARHMSQSFRTPHFWVGQQADATRLKEVREQLLPTIEAETGERLTYTDLIIKSVARAVEEYPDINSRWADDVIELLEDINIGLALNLPSGLIVPVLSQANQKSLAEITQTRADLINRGRKGKLCMHEVTGSTLTITNAGMAGIDLGYPILNPPEATIIALGAIKERPVAVNGTVLARLTVNLTVAIDHRVLDGFIAAEFLNRLKALIEEPAFLLP